MSKNVIIKKAERRKKIQELLPLGKSYEEIAAVCGVTCRTINRDIREWKKQGGFEDWLLDEFFRLHGEVAEGDWQTRYKVVSRLLEKTLKQRVEAEVKNKEGSSFKVEIVDNSKDSIQASSAAT